MTPHNTKTNEIQAMIEDAIVPLTDVQEKAHTEKVLRYLTLTPASYPAEMTWDTGIGDFTLKTILYRLEQDGIIERIPVDLDRPDPRLLTRVPDQSAKGQGGYENFSKKRWYGITLKGRAQLVKN